MPWRTHITYLRQLGKYGEEVQQVLDRGIVTQPGNPRLKITRIMEPQPNTQLLTQKE